MFGSNCGLCNVHIVTNFLERSKLIDNHKTQENPRLRAAAEELKNCGVKIGDAVSEALKTIEESELARVVRRPSLSPTAAVSSTIATMTEPIRNTAAYKTLAETLVDGLDDSGTAKHAGFEEKDVRRARRQLRLAKAGKEGRIKARVVADPEYVS